MNAGLTVATQPVFALIAAEWMAHERFDAAYRNSDSVVLGRKPTDAELDAKDAAADDWGAAFETALAARPTNAAEVGAILDLFP